MISRRTGNRTIKSRFLYGLYLLFSIFLLLEIALRIYDPFHFRLKGDKIILPVNQSLSIRNDINPKLDKYIQNSRNSLGFRGEEPPSRISEKLSIITVGGSTTECHFLDDKKTWPYLLGNKLSTGFKNVWLNNAGLDGHSSFGHIVLLNDHIKKLGPAVVLFLIGINDVELESPTFHDKLNTRGGFADFKHYLFQNSEVLNLVLNLMRGWRAQKFNNTTNKMLVLDAAKKKWLSDSLIRIRLERQKPFVQAFANRVNQLIDTCVAWSILPVFITQPNQFGFGKDPVTGADLELFPCDPADSNLNGWLIWNMLELYNDQLRTLCEIKNLPLIDLAHLMPKNSEYFYDMSHFTNQGAEIVASILADSLAPLLNRHFPQFKK